MEELGNVVRRFTAYHIKSPKSKTAQVSILCEKR